MEINKDDVDNNISQIEQLERQWEEEQNRLAACVICENPELEDKIRNHSLERIGGLDISYSGDDDDTAVGCLVVYNPQTQKIVYSDLQTFTISVPYIPGYLAYREMPIYRSLLTKLKQNHNELFPEVILVDGQGRLHPRHCGSACVVGLEFGCPTIGVGKNMFCGGSFVQSGKKPVVLDGACDVCSDIHEFHLGM
ncbi:uncharacterized protein [Blastocystis hominis]|uniref:Endonuclease V n=1 Tax=Blastocystis hominis TaxID=12968 RepID=D8M5D5_BLAHO|nr:uncharacterized protein [Blastocystis hominis]CBK23274.2 unnamed protein product [Blastocystis hominis]|eukprot:XP_012897322.1 uncharacterized protein [Blastocystis hominis]